MVAIAPRGALSHKPYTRSPRPTPQGRTTCNVRVSHVTYVSLNSMSGLWPCDSRHRMSDTRVVRETHMLHERHVCHAPGLALLAIVPLGALVALLDPRR